MNQDKPETFWCFACRQWPSTEHRTKTPSGRAICKPCARRANANAKKSRRSNRG